MGKKSAIALSAALILLTCFFVMSFAETNVIEYAQGQTAMSLEEYLERGDETWFLTGKKAYTIQAM